MIAVSASRSPTGYKIPSAPLRTISRVAGVSAATTAVRIAIASRITFGQPSERDGRTKTSPASSKQPPPAP